MPDWRKRLYDIIAKRSPWAAAFIFALGGLAMYLQPAINNFVSSLGTARLPAPTPLDPCRPFNHADLADKGLLTCETLPARQTSAMLRLPKGTEIAFDAPRNSFFSKPAIRTQLFLAEAGATFSMKLKDEHGGELEIVDDFKKIDPDDYEPIGTGILKLNWCPRGSASCQTLPSSDRDEPFPGYRVFSGPDYLALNASFDGATVAIDYRLVQSYGDHRSADSIDPLAGVGFSYKRQVLPLGRIVSIRFTAISADTRMRIETLELSGESMTLLRGKVTLPKVISPSDTLIHLEPMGSKGLGKDVATGRSVSDGSFALPVSAGEYEAWAEVRSPAGRLFTGNCAVSVGKDDPWITFHPRTELPRAQRSNRKLCEQGTIALMPSADKDHFRR